jgi:hypothetical protein
MQPPTWQAKLARSEPLYCHLQYSLLIGETAELHFSLANTAFDA